MLFTESRMLTRVPSWRSIASCERSRGVRGAVLSIVDGAVTIAASSEIALAAERMAKKMETAQSINVTMPPKNPIFLRPIAPANR